MTATRPACLVLLVSAIAAIAGCPVQPDSQIPDWVWDLPTGPPAESAADAQSGDAAAGNQTATSTDLLTALARDMATDTRISIADQPPIAIAPDRPPLGNVLRDWVPPDGSPSAGTSVGGSGSGVDAGTGSGDDGSSDSVESGGGGGGGEGVDFDPTLLGSYHGPVSGPDVQIAIFQGEEHRADLIRNVDFFFLDLSDGGLITRITLPRFVLTRDLDVTVGPIGETRTLGGRTTDVEGTYQVTVTVLDRRIVDGASIVDLDLVIRLQAGSLTLDGVGRHRAAVRPRAAGYIDVQVQTDYDAQMLARAPGLPDVLVHATETMNLNGRLHK